MKPRPIQVAAGILTIGLTACSGRTIKTSEMGQDAPSAAPAAKSEQVQARPMSGASGKPEAQAEYHFSLAQSYVAEGNPDRAIEEYKLVLVYDPGSSLVYARLATEYIKKGMLSAAMETCKEALQRDPKFTDARLILAGLYSTSRETDSALREYDTVLKFFPGHEEAAIYRAQVLLEDEQPEVAAQGLLKFLKQSPDSPLGYYYLGRAYQRGNKFKESSAAFQKAMELRSGFTQAALALGFLYEEKGMNAQAITVYKRMFEETQDASAANRIATILLKQEKYSEAIPYLEMVESVDPDDLNVRVKLGLIYMELKQHAKAIATFKSILLQNPESDRIHYYLGSLYEDMKDTESAIQHLKQIKADSKLFADGALHVAYLLKQAGQVDGAKAYIQSAIDQSPRVPGFYLFQANLEEESKELAKAVGILEKAHKIFPEDEKVKYYLGSLYDRQGNTDKSLEIMESILVTNPHNVDALNYIGYTWTVRGMRLHEAEKMIRRALALKPDNGYVQDSWGWYLYVRGRVPEAVIELEKAARLKPNEPTILDHLADAYLKMNLREKALQKYTDAIKHAEDDDSREKIAKKLETLRTELVREGRIKDRMPASER